VSFQAIAILTAGIGAALVGLLGLYWRWFIRREITKEITKRVETFLSSSVNRQELRNMQGVARQPPESQGALTPDTFTQDIYRYQGGEFPDSIVVRQYSTTGLLLQVGAHLVCHRLILSNETNHASVEVRVNANVLRTLGQGLLETADKLDAESKPPNPPGPSVWERLRCPDV
jgi:hypothetical protein